jgi:phosphatidylglycerol:prolipoprotein diacylglycerol transferase
MLEIDINPILQIGSLQIRWIFLISLLGFMIAIGISIWEAKRRGKRLDYDVIGLSLSFIIGSLVGGKLFYILDNWEYMLKYPVPIILSPYVVMYGVLIGSLTAIFIYNWRFQEMSFWETGDIIAPGSMLSLAIYRVGCIINGCCHGVPADLPWSVTYTNPNSSAPLNIPLHPTQLYHLVLGILAFAILWQLRRRLKPEGALFLLWLVLLAATDLPVRLFRTGDPFLLDIQQAQLVGVITLAIALPWLIIRIRSFRKAK